MILFPLFFSGTSVVFLGTSPQFFTPGISLGRMCFFLPFLRFGSFSIIGRGLVLLKASFANRWWRGVIRVFGFFELDSRVEPPVVYGRGASVKDVLGEAQGFFCVKV